MKVLYIAPHLAVPPIGGPELRTWNSIRAIADIDEVKLRVMPTKPVSVTTRDAPKLINVSFPDARGPRERHQFFGRNERLVEAVVRESRDFGAQVIWWSFASLHAEDIRKVRSLLPGVLVVADTDSVWSRFVHRGVVAASSQKHERQIRNEARMSEAAEKTLSNYAHIVTAVSEVDAEHYRSLLGSAQICVFANVVDAADFRTEPTTGWMDGSVVSVSGSFYARHSPMVHGTMWLLREVMPRVWSMNAEVQVQVIGKGSTKYFDVDDARFRILGQVEEIGPIISRTRAALVPLFFESGTRFKILEAAALGVPVVSTSLGVEGLTFSDMHNIHIADTAQEFADRIDFIVRHPEHSLRLSEDARNVVQAQYSLGVATAQARAVLEAASQLMSEGAARS